MRTYSEHYSLRTGCSTWLAADLQRLTILTRSGISAPAEWCQKQRKRSAHLRWVAGCRLMRKQFKAAGLLTDGYPGISVISYCAKSKFLLLHPNENVITSARILLETVLARQFICCYFFHGWIDFRTNLWDTFGLCEWDGCDCYELFLRVNIRLSTYLFIDMCKKLLQVNETITTFK